MRAVMVAVVVLAALVVALSQGARREPSGLALANAIEPPIAQPFAPGASLDRTTPDPEPPRREAVPAPDASGPFAVLFCESATLAPLARVNAKLWVYAPEGNRSIVLDVDDAGRACIARDALRTATAIAFEVLAESSRAWVVRPGESIEQLRDRTTPLPVLVPRDRVREVRVVDENGAGVAGARVEGDMIDAVVTDARGCARPRLTDPPPHGVYVCAVGRRFEYVPVPPDAEPWVVVLRRANRLEIALDTGSDPGAYHVDVRLSPAFSTRTFYQSKYVQTPGRAVDGTPGSFSEPRRGHSLWQLGFGPERLAVLDQLHDGGQVELELRRFDELLETRTLELPGDGAVTRVAFRVAPAPPVIALRVLDRTGSPLCGVSVRPAPRRGAVIDHALEEGFPIWAPRVMTDALGVCHLPRPAAPDTVFVLARDGCALRALTLAELAAADFRVRLERGFSVEVEVRGRDGEVLTEGPTTGFTDHVRPSARLGHDVWLDAAGGGDGPLFHFDGLPAGVVEFRFTHLSRGEVLRHDTRVPNVLFVASESIDDLMLGK